MDTGRPGPSPGHGVAYEGQTSHHQCVQSLDATGPLAILSAKCVGMRRCQNHGPMEGLCAAAVAPQSLGELCGKGMARFLSLSGRPCRTLSQADPGRDWSGTTSTLLNPGLCRGPVPQAWPFCPFLGSVVCPCLRLRVGGRQGRQRQKAKASRQGGHGDSPRSREKARGGGEACGIQGASDNGQGQGSIQGPGPRFSHMPRGLCDAWPSPMLCANEY